jgi:hypothetical protein
MGYLSDRLTATAPQLKAACGENVTYGTSTITAMWNPDQCIPEFFPDGEQYVDTGVLTVDTANVASPAIDDTVTIRGKTYYVKAIGQGSSLVPLQMVRYDRQTIGRGNRRSSVKGGA